MLTVPVRSVAAMLRRGPRRGCRSDLRADMRDGAPTPCAPVAALRSGQMVAIDNDSQSGMFVDGQRVSEVGIYDGLTIPASGSHRAVDHLRGRPSPGIIGRLSRTPSSRPGSPISPLPSAGRDAPPPTRLGRRRHAPTRHGPPQYRVHGRAPQVGVVAGRPWYRGTTEVGAAQHALRKSVSTRLVSRGRRRSS